LRRLTPLAAVVALATAACGTPPELSEPRGTTVPRPTATASPSPTPTAFPTTVTPSPFPTATGSTTFADSPAVSCGGRPSAAQVIALLKRNRLLPSSFRSQPTVGPMCAGTWQWTVVPTSRGPLQAVTRGEPGSLSLVTAGTDVCSIEVRVGAPAGIRSAACDANPPGLAGA